MSKISHYSAEKGASHYLFYGHHVDFSPSVRYPALRRVCCCSLCMLFISEIPENAPYSSARRQVGGTYSITQINLHLMVYVKVWNQGAKHRLHRRAISSNSMAMVPLSLREFSFAPASFFIGPARYCYGHESLNSPQHPAMSKNFHKGYIAIIFQKSIKMSAADRILPVLQ